MDAPARMIFGIKGNTPPAAAILPRQAVARRAWTPPGRCLVGRARCCNRVDSGVSRGTSVPGMGLWPKPANEGCLADFTDSADRNAAPWALRIGLDAVRSSLPAPFGAETFENIEKTSVVFAWLHVCFRHSTMKTCFGEVVVTAHTLMNVVPGLAAR